MQKIGTSRLATLMDFMGVTGRDLAHALHVDYSLVSKWRNNTRRLTRKSVHLARAVEHFMSLDSEAGYRHIREIIRDQYEDAQQADYQTLCIYLGRWLSETTTIGTHAPILRSDPEQRSYTAHFDVFAGDEGRRRAVLRFLDQALQMPPGQEVLLLSQEDMNWLLHDSSFRESWVGRLQALIARDAKLTVIHTLDRDFSDLKLILGQWLPLHMTGKLQSFFHPRYLDSSIKRTLFLVRGQIAVLGSQVTDGGPRYTAYMTDLSSVQHAEETYDAFLAECRQLFRPMPLMPITDLFASLNQHMRRRDNNYMVSPTPLFAVLPEALVLRLLEKSGVKEPALKQALDLHRAAVQAFDECLKAFQTRHIYSLSAIQQCLVGENLLSPELSLIAGRSVSLNRDDMRDFLSHLAELLQRHSNLQVAFAPPPIEAQIPRAILWVQENGIALASNPLATTPESFALLSDEPTISGALYAFCDGLWAALPRINREKRHTLERIGKLTATEMQTVPHQS